MKYTIIFVSVFSLSPLIHALEAPAKEATCRACHGIGGAKPIAANYPKLSGQNQAYLVGALKAYRDGQRTGGLAAVMNAQASQLSDTDIDALAAYYASQP